RRCARGLPDARAATRHPLLSSSRARDGRNAKRARPHGQARLVVPTAGERLRGEQQDYFCETLSGFLVVSCFGSAFFLAVVFGCSLALVSVPFASLAFSAVFGAAPSSCGHANTGVARANEAVAM